MWLSLWFCAPAWRTEGVGSPPFLPAPPPPFLPLPFLPLGRYRSLSLCTHIAFLLARLGGGARGSSASLRLRLPLLGARPHPSASCVGSYRIAHSSLFLASLVLSSLCFSWCSLRSHRISCSLRSHCRYASLRENRPLGREVGSYVQKWENPPFLYYILSRLS